MEGELIRLRFLINSKKLNDPNKLSEQVMKVGERVCKGWVNCTVTLAYNPIADKNYLILSNQ